MVEDNQESLRTISGTIRSITPDKRAITLWTLDGMIDGGTWDPAQDKEFRRLKPGWSARITLEKRGDKWIAISQTKGEKTGQRKAQGQQDNQRGILTSVLIKAYIDLYCHSMAPDEIDFEKARGDIMAAVEKDLPEYLRIGGA